MTCGQIQLGGCDLDLAHTGPCVLNGVLSKSARARMTPAAALLKAKSQLLEWGDPLGPLGRNVPEVPPGQPIWSTPKKSKKKYKKVQGARPHQMVPDEAQTLSNATFTNGEAISIVYGADVTLTSGGKAWMVGPDGNIVSGDSGYPRQETYWSTSANSAGPFNNAFVDYLSRGEWEPVGLECWPCHPALPWEWCLEIRVHPPHRRQDGITNCPGRRKAGRYPGDRNGVRTESQARREMRKPGPGDPMLCTCDCGCQCDGRSHFNDDLCACYYLGCGCVQDRPDEPLVLSA